MQSVKNIFTYAYNKFKVELLNLRTGNFSQIEPLKYHRKHSATVVIGQGKFAFVYVLGGMGNENLSRSVERQ